MISMLTGTIAYHGVGFVFLKVGDIGYKVDMPESVAHGLSGEVTLYTQEVVRDDSRVLFGFTTIEGVELSWKLTSVPGVGPKLAQKISYGGQGAAEVKNRIEKGDVAFLQSIPGVGKKTAQKIVLELQGKLVEAPVSTVDLDALSALMSLGYTKMQAEEALRDLSEEIQTVDEMIKAALKLLGK